MLKEDSPPGMRPLVSLPVSLWWGHCVLPWRPPGQHQAHWGREGRGISFLSQRGQGWEGTAFISHLALHLQLLSPPNLEQAAHASDALAKAVQSHLYLVGREDQQVAGLQGELAPAAPQVAGRVV